MTTSTAKGRPVRSKRSPATAKQAGRDLENWTAEAFRLEGLAASRLRLNGAKDVGDVLVPDFDDLVIECKNTIQIRLTEWMAEAEREMANAGAAYAVVVHKRLGSRVPSAQWASTSLGHFVRLVSEVVRLRRRVAFLEEHLKELGK